MYLALAVFDVALILLHERHGRLKMVVVVFDASFYNTAQKEAFQVDINRDTETKEEEPSSAAPFSDEDETVTFSGVIDEIAFLHGRGSCRRTHPWLDVDHFCRRRTLNVTSMCRRLLIARNQNVRETYRMESSRNIENGRVFAARNFTRTLSLKTRDG